MEICVSADDNAQALPGSSSSASPASHDNNGEEASTNGGGSSTAGRRRHRVLSTNGVLSNHAKREDSPIELQNNRLLRVGLERLDVNKLSDVDMSDSNETQQPAVRRNSRKTTRPNTRHSSSNTTAQESPSPKRRKRSELDKLLEAGSSSFHFETAREATNREGEENSNGGSSSGGSNSGGNNLLGPIHIDVSETNSLCEEENSATATTSSKISTRRKKEEESEEDDGDAEEEEEVVSSKPSPGRKRGRKRGQRRAVLTKDDLLSGPAYLPSKKEQEEKKGRKGPGGRRASKCDFSEYIPQDRFEQLDSRLGEVDGQSIPVDDMHFSFEKTPFNEGWFQTYTRQDQGDEILFYPESKSFQLPYEMPITTFYPSKKDHSHKFGPSKSASTNESRVPSGSATPQEEPVSPRKGRKAKDLVTKAQRRNARIEQQQQQQQSKRKDSKASTDSESLLPNLRQAAILARLAPGLRSELFSRKSPRCHASTKALLTNPGDEDENGDPVDDEEDVDDMEALLLEEQSDSSLAPHKGGKVWTESSSTFSRIAGQLDSFMREEDPMLMTDTENEDLPPMIKNRRKKRRRSSSGKSATKQLSEDPMDRMVASNVDSVLLDCLEDELPSVALDEEVPGSEPLELLATYEQCDSMAKCGNSRWTKPRNMPRGKPPLMTKPSPVVISSSSNLHPVKSEPPSPAVVKKEPRAIQKLKEEDADADSSSEYATSVCSLGSEASSTTRKMKKRKRNLTGFPTPKKKKPAAATSAATPVRLKISKVKKPATAAAKKSPAVLRRSGGRRLRDLNQNQKKTIGNRKRNSPPAKKAKASPTRGRKPQQQPEEDEEDEDSDDEEEEEEEDVEEEEEQKPRPARGAGKKRPKNYKEPADSEDESSSPAGKRRGRLPRKGNPHPIPPPPPKRGSAAGSVSRNTRQKN